MTAILIRQEAVRKLGVLLAFPTLLGAARALGQDDAGAPRATMTCDRVDAPGRVRCEVEARVGGDRSISWGDVVIVRTPAFVGALRGRIGPHDATVHDPDVWRWALALVAKDRGAGDVEGRVRLVVCRAGRCAPSEIRVVAHVAVGE